MKKVNLLLAILLCFCIKGTYAQVSKTIHVETAGQLASLLTDEEKATITDLTVTGHLNEQDYLTMNASMPNLKVIDMADAMVDGGGIPANAFKDKISLTSVTMPWAINYYEPLAFYGCNGLTSINVPGMNINYSSIDGVVFSKNRKEIIHYPYAKAGEYIIPSSVSIIREKAFANCRFLASVTIPDSVHNISGYAFTGCIGLTSVNLPDSLIDIKEGAFNNCKSLSAIIIPATVKSIRDSAFQFCSKIASINIPNSVTYIGKLAFYFCSSLSSVSISSSVTFIEDRAFHGCASLTNFSVSDNNLHYSSLDGVLFNKEKTILIHCPAMKKGTYNIPSSVSTINANAFIGCQYLTSITIPSSVDTIKEAAFMRCISLTQVIIPPSVTTIDDNVFQECYELVSVSLPKSITYMGKGVFRACGQLKSVTIPPVNHIPDNAFAFCRSLTAIVIPDSVKSIGKFAFEDCSALTSISIASSVQSIDYAAFIKCSGLETIYVYSSVPVNLSSNWAVFLQIDKTKCILKVPEGSKYAYAAADQWQDFENIEEFNYCLSLSDTELYIESANGNSSFFNIISNTEWNISVNQPWLNIGQTSGSDNGLIAISAEGNPNRTFRWAIITITGQGITSQTIQVTQAPYTVTDIAVGNIETLTLYPNPVSAVLFIDGAAGNEMGIYSIQGSMLLKKTLESDHESIDFSAMQPGMYLVKIGEKSYKVIK